MNPVGFVSCGSNAGPARTAGAACGGVDGSSTNFRTRLPICHRRRHWFGFVDVDMDARGARVAGAGSGPGPPRHGPAAHPTMTALTPDHLLYERRAASTLTPPTSASHALRFGPSDAPTSLPSSAPSAAYALDRLGAQSERRPKPLLETDWHEIAIRAAGAARQFHASCSAGVWAVCLRLTVEAGGGCFMRVG